MPASSAEPEPEATLRPPWMRALTAVIVINMLGAGLYAPVSLLYFTEVSGIPLQATGLCLSGAQLVTLPLPLVIGRLVDRYGARAIVTSGMLLEAAGFLGYLFVADVPALALAAGVAAVGQRTYWSSVFTLIADLADGPRRDHAFGVSSAAQNAGVGVGALLAALLLMLGDESAYRLVVGLNAATFVLAALVLVRGVPRPAHRRPTGTGIGTGTGTGTGRPAGGPLRDRPFLLLTGANTIFAVCSGLLALGLPVLVAALLEGAGWSVGVLLGLNTAALAFGQTLVVRRTAGHRRTRVLALAGMGWAVWGVLMAVVTGLPPAWVVPCLFVFTALYTIAEMLHAPVSMALASELGPVAERGRYMSAFQLSFALSGVVAPAAFTVLFGWGAAVPWLVIGAAALLAGLTVVGLESRLPAAAVHPAVEQRLGG